MTVSREEFHTLIENFQKVWDYTKAAAPYLSEETVSMLTEPYTDVFNFIHPYGEDFAFDFVINGICSWRDENGTHETTDVDELYEVFLQGE